MRATLIHDRPVELDAGWLRRHFATAGTPAETLYGDEGTDADRAAGTAAGLGAGADRRSAPRS